MKYYDPSQRRLIYVRKKPTSDFWDDQWKGVNKITAGNQNIRKGKGKYSPVVRITQKYLRRGDGYILEGGCGLGGHVRNLTSNGFACIGVDYAENTVKYLNALYPELRIQYGDVRNLQFEDNYFAGYWSLGVIEHFWDGYQDIAKEMCRVIRPGGFLFLTFPYMNLLRRIKAKMGLYELHNGLKSEDFYQFALDKNSVIKEFETMGFSLIKQSSSSVLPGIKDEIGWTGSFVDLILENKGKNITTITMYNVLKEMLDNFMGSFAGHIALLIFKR